VELDEGTCPPGDEEYDYCLALGEEVSLGCGETQAFCPTEPYVHNASGLPPALTCDRCALLTMEDWNEQIWLGGEVRWAPFAQSEEEELQLKGYNVGLLNDCGVEIQLLQTVPVRSGLAFGSTQVGGWD